MLKLSELKGIVATPAKSPISPGLFLPLGELRHNNNLHSSSLSFKKQIRLTQHLDTPGEPCVEQLLNRA